MRRKTPTSVEEITQNQVKTRFKVLFWPTISYYTAISIISIFSMEIFSPTIPAITKNAVYFWMSILLYIIIMPLLAVWLLRKIFDVEISHKGLFGYNLRCQRRYISWNEVATVKSYQILGVKTISIRVNKKQDIQLTWCYHDGYKILKFIRQHAGEDHPLVHVLEKDLSNTKYSPGRFLWKFIGSIGLILSVWLISGNLIAAELEKPMKQAIASYVRQYPNQPPNQSAIELQSLMTKLGLSEKVFGDGSKVTVKPDKGSWIRAKVLEQELDKYLTIQLYNIKDSYHATPAKLKEYLQEHQADIEAIENHLLTKPLPQWGTDLSWLEKDNSNGGDNASSTWTKYLSLNELQRILAVNILDKNQSSKTEISKDLIALEKILQSLQNQATEEGQSASRTGERRIAKLARQLHNTPSTWGENLFNHHRYSAAILGSEKFLMIGNKVFQEPETIERWSKDKNTPWLWLTKYHRLIQPYLRIGAADFYDKNQRNLSLSKKRSLCHLTEIAKITYSPVLNEIANQRLSIWMINDYDKVALNDWRWELTSAVRQVKDQLMQGQTTNQAAQKFNMPSTVCPGEKWIAKAENNSVTISFSKELDWEALNINKSKNNPDFEQLPYRVQQIAKG
jgi:hypothetical protein